MSAPAETGPNPHIARMMSLIAPPDPPPAAPVPQVPEAPRRTFAKLSPFFDEAHRARRAATA